MGRIIMFVTVAAPMAAMLALAGAASAQSTPQPVDPPPRSPSCASSSRGSPQNRQRQREGYAAEGPCVPSPSGVGAMGTHALNPELLGAQFPEGTMDPENPPVLLLNENDEVMGVEWEAADVG